MTLDILCTPAFTAEESNDINRVAATLNLSREEVIRTAVKFFAAECVPTHGAHNNTSGLFFAGVCVPTQKVRT